MARRDLEPAVRLRLSPATEVVVSRTSLLFLRGDRVFRLDDREARRLIAEISAHSPTASLSEAVGSLLSASIDETT
jgi:hypothetical protein